MYDGNLVVDATTHTYNWWSEGNCKNYIAKEFSNTTFDLVNGLAPEGYGIAPEQFFKDQTVDDMIGTLFLESDTDYGIFHSTKITDYYEDGLTRLENGLEARERYPTRIGNVLGSVNPVADDALEQMERQVEEHDVDGIKLYPVRYKNGRSLSLALDDPEVGVPLLEKAEELGVDRISVHKAVPLGRTGFKHFGVDDIHDAAAMYPDINFEIVHAGFSFLEETKYLVGRYDNVWANFEITSALLGAQPREFARVLGELLTWAGPDRILWATGCLAVHPQPLIERFWEFEFPEELREEYGYPELTDEIKRKIMSRNALRLYGEDPDEIREQIQGDEIAERKEAQDERPEPWSSVEPTGRSEKIEIESEEKVPV
jgi:predicted TIM-barrel fold metal-dependent hydrolase